MKYILLLIITTSFIFQACSEIKDNINEPDDVMVHPEGIDDPASPDFHGKLIKNLGWNMTQCESCHGTDFHGGTVEVSCTVCHNQPAGPENCSTCHGSARSPAPPSDLDGNVMNTIRGVGAHQVHLSGNIFGKTVSCAECHMVPTNLYSPGHIDSTIRAEVIMKNFLATLVTNDPSVADPLIYDQSLPVFTPDPAYDSTNLSCSNTYCHGGFKNGNTGNAPVWTDPVTAVCGTCHGDPGRPTLREKALPRTVNEGGSHPGGVQCHLCHGGVVDDELRFIDISKHVDGKLNFLGNDYRF